MSSVFLTSFQRQMLDIAVSNGGAATFEQMRDARRKTNAEAAAKLFVDYNMLQKKGAGYVVTPAGLLACATGYYDTKWANAAPAASECSDAIADALVPKMATSKSMLGPDFAKSLVAKVAAQSKAAPYPSGRCARCKQLTEVPALTDGDSEWKCAACRAAAS